MEMPKIYFILQTVYYWLIVEFKKKHLIILFVITLFPPNL